MHDLFIKRWKQFDFSGFNEADIREEFIMPLLRVLGYSKNTVDEIIREKSLRLSADFSKIGRKRIVIDYIPTVRLKTFWIIEAKPGNSKQMTYEDFLQVHLYAIHPEIRAKYIVLINGHEIRIYDALTASSWEETLVTSTQIDADVTFGKVVELLSAKKILSGIRKEILNYIEKSLSVEVDEDALTDLKRNLLEIISKSRPIIKENARTLRRNAWKKEQEGADLELQNCSFDTLLVRMDMPLNMIPIFGREVTRRLLSTTTLDQQKIIDKLAMSYRSRCHSIFRVHCVDVFARLFGIKFSVKSSNYVSSIIDCLEELVISNMSYWGSNEISNALVHLDNITLRIAKKFCLRFMMKPIEEINNNLKKVLSSEEFLIKNPTVAKQMVPLIGLCAESFWRKYSKATDASSIWEGIWEYELYEECLDKIPVPKYPDKDRDLLPFDSYGRGFDMLCMGTWDILELLKKWELILPEKIKQVLYMKRNEVIASIPKSKVRPSDWKPTK